jgi:pimeloyl-ACP methyl ester carboxylesterase
MLVSWRDGDPSGPRGGPLRGARDRSTRAGTPRSRRRPPRGRGLLRAILDGVAGLRRVYPDLSGMGRTIAPETLRSADDVVDTLLNFVDAVIGATAHLLIGHSAGAYFAQAMAARRPAQVAGLVRAIRRPSHRARRPGSCGANRRAVGAHPRSRAGLCGPDSDRGGAVGLDGRVCRRDRPRRPLPARVARRGRRRGSRPAARATRTPAGPPRRVARACHPLAQV